MKFNRRTALSLLGLTAATPLSAKPLAMADVPVTFDHGVASGDPLADRVVLWTRATLVKAAPVAAAITWEMAHEPAFKKIVNHGVARADIARDYTVKVDATGLKPNTEYFYRFRAGKTLSPVGRARTLPIGATDKVVLAFTTCALYPGGYFNAYDHIAKLDRVDAVVELGDYYYEYGAKDDDYGMAIGKKLGRVPEPPHDIVTLADYRTRHALYKRDKDLQAAHARAAWICVWDDHETANDSWVGGAENHDPKTEGPWVEREEAALRAYYEWMPIREPQAGKAFEAINRSFQFGDLASLIMVETRLVARSRQLEYDRPGDIPMAVYKGSDPASRKRVTDPDTLAEVAAAVKTGGTPPEPYVLGPDVTALRTIIDDPERQMLGARQEEWLKLEIAASVQSGKPWQILGNQVVVARVHAPDMRKALGADRIAKISASLPEKPRKRFDQFVDFFTYDIPFDLDGWDGYTAARERLYASIMASNSNAVIVSGDSHAFWVNELYDASGTAPVAAEFGVSSVTSPSLGDYLPGIDTGKVFMDQNKEVLFNDQTKKGYTLVTITPDEVTGALIAINQLKKPYDAATLATFKVSPKEGPGIGAITKI